MFMSIANVLSAAEIKAARSVLARAKFDDGQSTAGYASSLVKSNTQARAGGAVDRLRESIENRLREHPVFALATLPKRIIGPQFSRYVKGHGYGIHVDEPVMDGSRADLSFTLFVSDPDSYGGGELVIEMTAGQESVKLPAGYLVVYPSTTLHRISEVTSGERLAAVGWVRSFVSDPRQRELLFDLATIRHKLFEAQGKTAEFDVLSKCIANLQRMWLQD